MAFAALSSHFPQLIGYDEHALMSKRQDQRLTDLVRGEGDFVTRSLRNLGVVGGDLDDCVQKVFLVAARRITEIEEGKERAFLFACARNIASHFRRSLARKREVPEDSVPEREDISHQPDRLTEQKHYREFLDQILESMDDPMRSAFMLYYFEEMTMAEIATTLNIPAGTVASRLRRAKQVFRSQIMIHRRRQTEESA